MSSDFSQFSSQNTQHSLHDGTAVDLDDNQSKGKAFFDNVYRILKVGSIYDIEHNQTQIAIAEFLEFFSAAMANSIEDSFSIIIRDELAIVNGTTLRLDRNAQKRHNELRDLFTAAKIRGLGLLHDMSAHDFTTFLVELKAAERSGQGMEHVDIPTIEISHGEPIRSILEALKSVNKSMYVAHVYIRGLVKVKNMHQQVRDRQDSDVPMGVIKRILQTVSEMLADDDFTILGLLPMKLVPGDLSSHSFNTAIYSMLLADRLGLPAQTTTYVGMAALYQDLDRLVGVAVGHRDRESILDTNHQFNSNLRDVAKMLGRVEGDVISTLRILLTYERGCTFDGKIARPFYRKGRDLHLVTRILDLCRVYDLLMQGLEGYKARRPDLAIQYIESRAGEAFDEELVELFVSTMGIYPIGTTVELTTGERGIVIRTPSPASDPRRPVVKLLQNDVVIDLSDGRYDHLEISRSVKTQEQDFASSRLFLLT
jgi:HD-GYP domain-containing protein (c-di-GMP phosphodiesterase class II)